MHSSRKRKENHAISLYVSELGSGETFLLEMRKKPNKASSNSAKGSASVSPKNFAIFVENSTAVDTFNHFIQKSKNLQKDDLLV